MTATKSDWIFNSTNSARPLACQIAIVKLKDFRQYTNPYKCMQWNGEICWKDKNNCRDDQIEKYAIINET